MVSVSLLHNLRGQFDAMLHNVLTGHVAALIVPIAPIRGLDQERIRKSAALSFPVPRE